MKVNKYYIRHATPSGGSAGKGYAKTTAIQVLDANGCVKKVFPLCSGGL